MDEVFTLRQPRSVIDHYGTEHLETAATFRVFGGFTFDRAGRESVESAQLTAHNTATLTIRHFPGLTAKWTVIREVDGTEWNIDRITDLGRQRFHTLTLTRTENSRTDDSSKTDS